MCYRPRVPDWSKMTATEILDAFGSITVGIAPADPPGYAALADDVDALLDAHSRGDTRTILALGASARRALLRPLRSR